VCGQPKFNARDIPEIAHRDMVPGLPDDGVRTTDLERWALPTRFGREYAVALRESPCLTVWTGLTCTEIVTTEAGDSVEHLVIKTLDGRQGRVVATEYVIATGGLEATRLLLVSNRHHPSGLGNAGGHLSALDGLRALSVIAVVWHHISGTPGPAIAGKGYMGVDFFSRIGVIRDSPGATTEAGQEVKDVVGFPVEAERMQADRATATTIARRG
jgi:hypothetical protein